MYISRGNIAIGKQGITLIEILVVISIVGILIVALGFSFQGWMAKYRVEAQVKQMYADMMNARVRAITMHTVHSVTFNTVNSSYSVLANAVPLPTYPKALPANYFLNENIPGAANTITFDTSGVASPADPAGLVGTVWITTVPAIVDVDYDCVVIVATRINMGLMTGGVCAER